MKERDGIESLAQTAQRDAAPRVDVAGRVLATIRARQADPVAQFGRRLSVCAAVACAVALLMVIPALDAYVMLQDPFSGWFSTLAKVLP